MTQSAPFSSDDALVVLGSHRCTQDAVLVTSPVDLRDSSRPVSPLQRRSFDNPLTGVAPQSA